MGEARAYRAAIRVTSILMAAWAIVAAAIGWFWEGSAGLWTALAGVAIAALSGIVTQVAMLVGHRKPPETFAAIVGGSWLAKMFIIVLGMLALTRVEGLPRGPFVLALGVGVVATLVVDVVTVRRARIPYVDTGSDETAS